MLKIIDAVEFIRSQKILEAWTNEQIALALNKAINTAAFAYEKDENGKITSLVFGEWRDNGETFYVTAFAGKGRVKAYIEYLKRTFPMCNKIEKERRGKYFPQNLKPKLLLN